MNLRVIASEPVCTPKAQAFTLVANYRDQHGLFAVFAVLYDHEPPLRCGNFFNRKTSKIVVRISTEQQESLKLGHIEVARDWGGRRIMCERC